MTSSPRSPAPPTTPLLEQAEHLGRQLVGNTAGPCEVEESKRVSPVLLRRRAESASVQGVVQAPSWFTVVRNHFGLNTDHACSNEFLRSPRPGGG